MSATGAASPPTARVVRVLEWLAREPEQSSSFSEIARQTGVSGATCHAILRTLVDAGFVMRHDASKSFSLGPALIRLGTAAERAFPALRPVREELHQLSRRLDMPAFAAAVSDHEIVVLDRVSPRSASDLPAAVRTIPFAAPFGIPFIAWAPKRETDEWIARSGVPVSDADREWLDEVCADARRTGFSINKLSDVGRRLRAELGATADRDADDDLATDALQLAFRLGMREHVRRSDLLGELVDLGAINAPVFDADGQVTLNLAVEVLRERFEVSEALRLAEEVKAAANRITRAIGGSLSTLEGRARTE